MAVYVYLKLVGPHMVYRKSYGVNHFASDEDKSKSKDY